MANNSHSTKKKLHVGRSIKEADFLKLREDRDAKLTMPSLMMPSIQINMRAGNTPLPEENVSRYIKVPLQGIKG